MQRVFFGAFRSEHVFADQKPNTETQYSNRFLCYLNPQCFFSQGDISCFAWGAFYDLNKTCNDLKLPATDNPAEALASAFVNNDFSRADGFYGEFAFLYVKNDTIVLGRDHIGAGMQVFYNDRYFASSLEAFKLIPGQEFQPDPLVIKSFLQLGVVSPPSTIIKGIKALGPGEIIVFHNESFKHIELLAYNQYRQLHNSNTLSENDAVDELMQLHRLAIKRRIASKSNPSFLISGGYDSGANLSAFRDVSNDNANGFSVGFKNDPWSELPLAEILANTFNINFQTYKVDGSEINELPKVVSSMNNPFNENGLMVNYLAMKLVAKTKPSIVLGGDGNDQLYGTGAQELALWYLLSKYRMTPFQFILDKMAGLAGNRLSIATKIRFHNNRLMNANSLSSFGFSNKETNWLMPDHKETPENDLLKINMLKPKSFQEYFLANTYYKSFLHDGLHLIIYKASAMAALYGQKISFPYMDKDIIRFIWSLPAELRVKGNIKDIAKGRGVNKYLHKKSYKPKLPDEITMRKKQGGFAPLPMFFKSEEQQNLVFDIIRQSDFVNYMIDEARLESFIKSFCNDNKNERTWFWQRQNQAFKAFNLLIMSLWWEIHINNKKAESLDSYK